MAFLKKDEKNDEELIKREELSISKWNEYTGKVGASHTGVDFIEGLRNTDKIKFKSTKFKIYDEKLIIERHKMIIKYSDIKEIFQDNNNLNEAIIILKNDLSVPIKSSYGDTIRFKAFLNILNNFIKKNKRESDNDKSNTNYNEESKNNVDRLLKLGEMYEKGLLTDEEFISMKQQLIQ